MRPAHAGRLIRRIHLRIEADYRKRGVTLPYEVAVKDNRHVDL